MPRLSLTLLGGFLARLPSGPALSLPTKKARALLAYLALRPGQAHSRDRLAALLWGDTADARARSSLRQTLSALRHRLPRKPGSLLSEGQNVALNPAAVDVDVTAFERRVAQGTPEALEQAAALYRGDLLDGFTVKEAPFEEWLLVERERLRELALEALARLLAHQSQAGATERAIQIAHRLLALDPLQEPVHRSLMRLYARQGRWAVALRQYQTCAGVLQRELGVEPEAETKQLHEEIRQKRAPRPPTGDTRAAREAPRRRRSVRLRPPTVSRDTALVGRDAELTRLRQALDETWRGHGQVVAIVGEAGIGKSRLVAELAAEALQRKGRVLLGRAYESDQILPFGPWADAVRAAQVFKDGDVLEGLPLAWRAELAWLFPELAEPGLPPSSDPADYLRLFEAVARFLTHLAAPQPLLLILEDLHWADDMSVRLLSFVGRRIPAWRVLMVVTAREEELAVAGGFGQALRELRLEQRIAELTLSPLLRAETVALVRALAEAEREDAGLARLAEQVWRASEGNPFMVVETMRAVREARVRELSGLRLPARIREVIAGRLDRLSPPSRSLAAAAAVIGRELDFALLHRVSGLSEDRAAEAVEDLVRRRVLHQVGERLDFTHDRIREVAYGQLLPPRRRLLHRRAAAVLETLYADRLEPHLAALGVHYSQGEVWPKALTYLRQAGTHAAARSAHREAVACFEQALAALTRLPSRRDTLEQALDLRLDLRNSLLPLGDSARILECLREAERLAATLGDQRRQGLVFSYLTRHFWGEGDHDRAVELGQRAQGIAAALGDVGLEVTTNFYLGVAYHSLGRYRQAIDCHRRDIAALQGDLAGQRFGLPAHPSVFSRTWLVWSLTELGEFTEEIARADEGVGLAEALDRRWDLTVANFGVGLLHLAKGEVEAACTVLERCLALCSVEEYPRWFAVIGAHLGHAYTLEGRIAQAVPLLEQAAAFTRSGHHARLTAYLSEAYLRAGRRDEAMALAAQTLDLARKRNERGNEAWALRLLGEIEADPDPPKAPAAECHYREALAVADELGMRPLRAHCHLGLGRLARRTGSRRDADGHLTAAARLFREMGLSRWVARTEAALRGEVG